MKWKLSAVDQLPAIFVAHNTSFPGDYLGRNDVH